MAKHEAHMNLINILNSCYATKKHNASLSHRSVDGDGVTRKFLAELMTHITICCML